MLLRIALEDQVYIHILLSAIQGNISTIRLLSDGVWQTGIYGSLK